MKKTISILLIVAMMLASMLAIIPASAAPAGTAIKSAADFANMADNGEYYLANDIVITASYAKDFKGTLDGNGNTIVVKGANPVFNKIVGGKVSNLNVEMAFTADNPGGDFGALAKNASGTFTNINISVEADFNGAATTGFFGGVFGQVTGVTTMTSVVATGFVKQTGATKEGNDSCTNAAFGGLIGGTNVNGQVLIENSISNVEIYSATTRASVGGIVGSSGGGTKLVIKSTQNNAKVDVYANGKNSEGKNMGAHAGVAGFVGIINSNSNVGASVEIYNSRNSGMIARHGSGDINMMGGGFIGRAYGTAKLIIDGCVNSGEIQASATGSWSSTSGIIANVETFNYNWSQNTAAEITVRNTVNTGAVGGADYTGGIIGSIIQANSPNVVVTIENCANYGDISGNISGGIFGFQGNGGGGNKLTIKNCYNSGTASSGIADYVHQQWANIGEYGHTKDKTVVDVANGGSSDVPTTPYLVPEIINCVNDGSTSNGIIKHYSYHDYVTEDSPMAGSHIVITNCVTSSGSVAPSESTFVVTDPDDEDALRAAVLAAIPGDPADLDAVLADYDGFVGEDYVAGWDTFEPVYKAALADANKATDQATLDAHIGLVQEAAAALELAEVDVDPLVEMIATANDKLDEAGDGSAYTPLTWDAFTLALEQAELVYEIFDDDTKPSTVKNATNKLSAALAALALIPTEAKADLAADIAKYEAYDETKYVSTTWAVLVEVIASTKAINDDINSTAEDVAAASDALEAAVAALAEKADPSALSAKANKALKDHPAANYTSNTYNKLRTLVSEINTIAEANDISAAGIAELSKAIDDAVAALVLKGNLDEVDALLEPFGEIIKDGGRPQVNKDVVETLKDVYTRESLNAFVDVLEEIAIAKKQDSLPKLSVDEVATLTAALQEAIDGLVPFASYTDIDAKLAEIAALDKTAYTKDSWKTLQGAINAIAALKSDRNATQEQADAALETLNAAFAGLVEATPESDDAGATDDDAKGCKSAIGATLVVMTATLALGATTLLKKKED